MKIKMFKVKIMHKFYHFYFSILGNQKSRSVLQSNQMVFRYFLAIHGIAFHQSDSNFGILIGYQ